MKTLVDKVKSGARTLAGGAAMGLASLAYSPKAEATIVYSFEDLIPDKGSSTSQYTLNNIDYSLLVGDNLMIRDLETGTDSIVSKNGTDVWRMGFVNYIYSDDDGVDDAMVFGGYANNDNYWSNNNPSSLGGWSAGAFYNSVFGSGEAVEDVYIVYDRLWGWNWECCWRGLDIRRR